MLLTGLSSALASPLGETLALTFAAGLGGAAVFALLALAAWKMLHRAEAPTSVIGAKQPCKM